MPFPEAPLLEMLRTAGTASHPDLLAGVILRPAKLPEPNTSCPHPPTASVSQEQGPFRGLQAHDVPAALPSEPVLPLLAPPDCQGLCRPQLPGPHGPVCMRASPLPGFGVQCRSPWENQLWRAPSTRPQHHPHKAALRAEPTLPSEATGIFLTGDCQLPHLT